MVTITLTGVADPCYVFLEPKQRAHMVMVCRHGLHCPDGSGAIESNATHRKQALAPPSLHEVGLPSM
eukprot:3963036-Heterocapsa_arctica.AAC.1